MFCANCGTENDDGAVFCSKCGKSPSGDSTVVGNKQGQQSGYPLSNLTAKLFSVLFEIILWVILVCGIIGGGTIGRIFIGNIFGGIVFGGIAAFVIIILTGGIVSLFIKLVNDTDEIKKKIK